MNMNITALLFLVLCISICAAKHHKKPKITKKEKKRIKEKEREEKRKMPLITQYNEIRKTVNIPTEVQKSVVLFDATLSDYTSICGPQVVTRWTENLDVYYPAGSYTISTHSVFTPSTGEFKPPVHGWYHICVSLRFKKGGESNDVTIVKNDAVVAAFGNADSSDWRSTGTCILMSLVTTDTVTVKHWSGGGSDCIEETDWNYGRFSGFLIQDHLPVQLGGTYYPEELSKTMKYTEEELEQMIKYLTSDKTSVEPTSFDATLSGYTPKCGEQTITGWSENHDDMNVFNGVTGQFTSQTDGWYRICASLRFRNTGNSNDVTLRVNGARVAAFGSALKRAWRSTGTCVIVHMSAGDYMDLYHESRGTNDCIEETGWHYSRFAGHLIARSDRTDLDTINLKSAMFDATLEAAQTDLCGSQTVTGWTRNIDSIGTVGLHVENFHSSTGIYIVPTTGKYMICAYFRFKDKGNSNDVSLMNGGSIVAAFGDAVHYDWRSTGTCTVQDVQQGSQLSLMHQSGGSSDCIEETGWHYARFSGYLIHATK